MRCERTRGLIAPSLVVDEEGLLEGRHCVNRGNRIDPLFDVRQHPPAPRLKSLCNDRPVIAHQAAIHSLAYGETSATGDDVMNAGAIGVLTVSRDAAAKTYCMWLVK